MFNEHLPIPGIQPGWNSTQGWPGTSCSKTSPWQGIPAGIPGNRGITEWFGWAEPLLGNVWKCPAEPGVQGWISWGVLTGRGWGEAEAALVQTQLFFHPFSFFSWDPFVFLALQPILGQVSSDWWRCQLGFQLVFFPLNQGIWLP